MSSLNKVFLMGRLTRDPEYKSFANGGGVCKFGFAVSDRKKNQQTGQWEDEPMFIDVEIFDSKDGKAATSANKYLRKGKRAVVEGKLRLDQWEDKTTGNKRSKHKLIAYAIQYIDFDNDDAPAPTDDSTDENRPQPDPNAGGNGEEIPF